MSSKFEVKKFYCGEILSFDENHIRINSKTEFYLCVKRNNKTGYISFQKYGIIGNPRYGFNDLRPIGNVISKKINYDLMSKKNTAVEKIIIEKGDSILDSVLLSADNSIYI